MCHTHPYLYLSFIPSLCVARSRQILSSFLPPFSLNMVKGDRLKKRATIISLTEEGYSPYEIMKLTGIDQNCVYRWCGRESTDDDPRSGRPSKLTRSAKALIKTRMIGKPRRSLRLMARELKRTRKADVHFTTIERYLKKEGARPYHRTIQPKLSEDNKKQRHRFSLDYRYHPWESTFFADEKKFQLFTNPNNKNDVVWAYDKASVPGYEVTQYAPSVHIWGAISIRGPTPIAKFSGRVDGESYKQTLAENYLPTVKKLYKGEECWLAQDKATPHTSHVVQDWMKEKKLKYIPPSEWPSGSPDLNPIENLWGWMQDKVNEKNIKTSEGLWREIKKIWGTLTPEFLTPYILSMDERLKLCKQSKGAAIQLH